MNIKVKIEHKNSILTHHDKALKQASPPPSSTPPSGLGIPHPAMHRRLPQKRPNTLTTTYHHLTNSYCGRSWVGVDKEKVLIEWVLRVHKSGEKTGVDLLLKS